MVENKEKRKYDLEERTFSFARNCRDFVAESPKILANIEYGKQLVRASGSVAANYIEANESLSKKDFGHRIKICRKEAKESRLWLRLYGLGDDENLKQNQKLLIQEAVELVKIFHSITRTCL